MDIELKLLTTVYPYEDQLVRDWLRGAGIETFRQSKAFTPLELSVGPLAEVKIFVRVEQYAEALQVLEAMDCSGEEPYLEK